jgi:hypothetical protein
MADERPPHSSGAQAGPPRAEQGPIKVSTDWTERLKDELGIDLAVDVLDLLDLARGAAHLVARPAAPLTTFLVGYAAAARGGGPAAVAEAAAKVRRLLPESGPPDTDEPP